MIKHTSGCNYINKYVPCAYDSLTIQSHSAHHNV
jgi:hypothetical protein